MDMKAVQALKESTNEFSTTSSLRSDTSMNATDSTETAVASGPSTLGIPKSVISEAGTLRSPKETHGLIDALTHIKGVTENNIQLAPHRDEEDPAITVKTSTAASPGPKVLYRVEYRDILGKVVRSEEDKNPIQLTFSTSRGDVPVLEVVTIMREENEKKHSGNDANILSGVQYAKSQAMVNIHSQKLVNALRAVVEYYPGLSLLGNYISIPEPYELLIYHRAELIKYKTQHPEEHTREYQIECNEHIDLVLNFLESRFGEVLQEEDNRHKRDPPVCTFEYLWLLLKPGVLCYHSVGQERLEPYVYDRSSGGIEKGLATNYHIAMWNIDFDGEKLGRHTKLITIQPFDGEREINSLTIYPTKFYRGTFEDNLKLHGTTLEQKLIKRGEKFWELTKAIKYKEYDGTTVDYPHRTIKGRIMVDFQSYFASIVNEVDIDSVLQRPLLTATSFEFSTLESAEQIGSNTGCECQSCSTHKSRMRRFHDYHNIYPSREPPNKDEFFFLCAGRVFAFVLKERRWEVLNVEYVRNADVQDDAFENLVLDLEIKSTLESLCRSYTKSRKPSKPITTDFVKGKGEGQIFLLHGPPGVGKTCTAECVAELTGRPLLALTCGDIGTTAQEVEKSLDKYLRLGELWGAVVLLDEADIYLEKRSVTDAKRNSIVSVFLRALEYYRGLLFLTTNRVNTFDEAFKSRIHVSLYYKKLGNEERLKIWANSFKRLEEAGVHVTGTAKQYAFTDPDVLNLELNGREIRNAFQTAVALAEFEANDENAPTIEVKSTHLKRVIALSAHFQKYLASMHRGKTDSQMAKAQGLRNDGYGESTKRGMGFEVRGSPLSKKGSRSYKSRRSEEELLEGEEEVDERLRKNRATVTSRAKGRIAEEGEFEEETEEEQSNEYRTKSRKPHASDEVSEERHLKPSRHRAATRPSKRISKNDDEDEDEDENTRDMRGPKKKEAREQRVAEADEED